MQAAPTNTIQCSTACTVTLVLQQPELTPERVQDLTSLFGLVLVAGVVVLAAKALYNRFRVDYEQ